MHAVTRISALWWRDTGTYVTSLVPCHRSSILIHNTPTSSSYTVRAAYVVHPKLLVVRLFDPWPGNLYHMNGEVWRIRPWQDLRTTHGVASVLRAIGTLDLVSRGLVRPQGEVKSILRLTSSVGARGSVVGWETMLQAGRSHWIFQFI
jgi:hypothetical protein